MHSMNRASRCIGVPPKPEPATDWTRREVARLVWVVKAKKIREQNGQDAGRKPENVVNVPGFPVKVCRDESWVPAPGASSESCLTPQTIGEGFVRVPLRRGRKVLRSGLQVRFHNVFVECNPQSGLIRYGNEAVIDDGLFHALYHRSEERRVGK